MISVVDPAADVLWDSVGTIMTLEGTEEIAPQTEDEWIAVRDAALAVADAGDVLLGIERLKGDSEWTGLSQALTISGKLAASAAESRDPEAVFRAGGDVYLVCADCHVTFAPELLQPNFQLQE